ncbi:MAG: nucleotidyltransferase [Gammaproteobacteria bacterium]|nr:MAG: nucleotidyltransferase [Gammaproteobacteria bacterium]
MRIMYIMLNIVLGFFEMAIPACYSPAHNEFTRDAVIQRFEFSFELAWTMLRLRLGDEGIDAPTPRAAIREAVAAQLLDDGDRWSDMLRYRNETSHIYDEALARKVSSFVCSTALPLLKALGEQARSW